MKQARTRAVRWSAVLGLFAGGLHAQDAPPLPQQPLVIRQTNLVTNVVISITTTITEVQGIKVDNRFIPLRTNLLFRTATNVWSTP